MKTMWFVGFALLLISLAGAFYPVVLSGMKDPFVILELTLGNISFWIFGVIGTVGAFLCYYGIEG